MPCWTVQESKVQFLAASTDPDVLATALEKLGYAVARVSDTVLTFQKNGQSGSYDGRTGRLELPQGWDLNEIKRPYSQETAESQARKFGWKLEWSTNAAGHRQAAVARRG
jgi:hypothetical protein